MKAPDAYWLLTEPQHEEICSGCGPGKWGSWLVPDRFRLIGVDFHEACNIHDFCYWIGMDKDSADRMFLENMSEAADRAWWGTGWIAHRFAFIYYLAVKHLGAGAYRNAQERS